MREIRKRDSIYVYYNIPWRIVRFARSEKILRIRHNVRDHVVFELQSEYIEHIARVERKLAKTKRTPQFALKMYEIRAFAKLTYNSLVNYLTHGRRYPLIRSITFFFFIIVVINVLAICTRFSSIWNEYVTTVLEIV